MTDAGFSSVCFLSGHCLLFTFSPDLIPFLIPVRPPVLPYIGVMV